MREREVVQRVAERLRTEGAMALLVRLGQERGPDIEARLPRSGRRLFIEAKGESESKQPSVNHRLRLGEALLQILSVYDADVGCAIATPYIPGYEKLARDILPGLRRLGLHVLLMHKDGVWHFAPDARGFFPTRPQSLMEELDR